MSSSGNKCSNALTPVLALITLTNLTILSLNKLPNSLRRRMLNPARKTVISLLVDQHQSILHVLVARKVQQVKNSRA